MILEQEKPNKIFFDQEKQKQKQKTIKQLETIENDKIITLTNDFQILKLLHKHFLRPSHQNTNKCENTRKTIKLKKPMKTTKN